MDGGDGCAAIAQVRGGAHHSTASLLRRSHRAPRLEYARGGNELNFTRRVLF